MPSYLLYKGEMIMPNYYCLTGYNHTGCGTNSSNVPLGGQIGVFKCPKCNMPYSQRTTLGGGAVGATGRHVCPKCGLMQHNTGGATGQLLIKAAYRAGRCCDCNQPLVGTTQGHAYNYCIKCGRIYDTAYLARKSNGSGTAGMKRCPKCGGNAKAYTAS